MGKAHRGSRLGKSKTAIQREALPDFLPPSHQANPAREDRGDAEFESGPSLCDQTPPHENIRGCSQGIGNDAWVTMVRISLGIPVILKLSPARLIDDELMLLVEARLRCDLTSEVWSG